jgi:2-(3-amino-3-carboxypropyl)histidine synthase
MTNGGIPSHINNNKELQFAISQTLPSDYEFEINKTIARIEKSLALNVALQFPEGLTMYASAIGDILVRFAYCNQPPPPLVMKDEGSGINNDGEKMLENGPTTTTTTSTTVSPPPRKIQSLSILGDVTYGACCIDDLSAKSLGCDILVHYGHSCLVPLTRTVIPCLYVFVEIHIDVSHLVDCVRLTFTQEEKERRRMKQSDENDVAIIIEACVMGTVQFRSAVIEAADRLNDDDISEQPPHNSEQHAVRFRAIVPQAKPLSPGEVLGCTSPSGLATLDIKAIASAASTRRRRRAKANNIITEDGPTEHLATVPDDDDENVKVEERIHERVMIFVADGRFHLEAAMISNPTLRALRYDPYSKTLTEERYETVKMKRLRRDAILETRRLLGISSSSSVCQWGVDGGVAGGSDVPKCGDDIANHILLTSSHSLSQSTYTNNNGGITTTMTMGIILGTHGRQGNPAILSRVRALLRKRGIRTAIVLLSEIFPSKLEAMSAGQCGIRAWVQIACPRLSVDWGHHFTVPVLSPFELFVALGEVADTSLLTVDNDGEGEMKDLTGYPMDFYSNSGGPWTNYHGENRDRKVVSYGN